jgi:peroxiredoxin
MPDRFKILALFVIAVIVILSVSAGLAFAVDSSCKVAAVLLSNLTILSEFLHSGQYRSFIKDLALVAFLLLLLFWRTIFLGKQQ